MSKMRVKQLVVGMVETNCYIIYNEETKAAVIVDPGDNPKEISKKCAEYGVKPEAVLLTHGHFDHIMAAEPLREEWGLKIYSSAKEEYVSERRSPRDPHPPRWRRRNGQNSPAPP